VEGESVGRVEDGRGCTNHELYTTHLRLIARVRIYHKYFDEANTDEVSAIHKLLDSTGAF